MVNRPGGGGAIAFAYVAGKKGDPHIWLTATTSFLTTPLLGKSKYTYKDFTPITNLAYDDFLITVRADSPYKTMKDLIDDAKKRPGQIRTGGTYAPGTEALISHMIEKAAGVKFNYIPFKSGGEAMVALLGGNLDMFYPNPGEALAQMEAKKVRILGVASEKRLAAAQDIPTLRELGINAAFQQVRSIAAPRALHRAAGRTPGPARGHRLPDLPHAPRGAGRDQLLAAPYGPDQDNLCRACHAEIRVKGRDASAPNQGCAACHTPHGENPLLLAGGPKLTASRDWLRADGSSGTGWNH